MDSHLFINSTDKILIVFPHPDDETFGAGCLIQKALKIGASVKVLILTKGEASTLKNGVNDPAQLPVIREIEFKNVMSLLGVKDYSIENFPDKGLRETADEVINYLAHELRTYTPDVVVTYEPSGIYGHPDHIALTKMVEDLHKEFDFKLVYSTVEPGYMPSEHLLKMAEHPEEIKPLFPSNFINLSLRELLNKIKCFNLYKSQFGGKTISIGMKIKFAFMFRKEYFYIEKTL